MNMSSKSMTIWLALITGSQGGLREVNSGCPMQTGRTSLKLDEDFSFVAAHQGLFCTVDYGWSDVEFVCCTARD